jgi:hypothetical protein
MFCREEADAYFKSLSQTFLEGTGEDHKKSQSCRYSNPEPPAYEGELTLHRDFRCNKHKLIILTQLLNNLMGKPSDRAVSCALRN